ncbi:MAG: hypothetical protein PVH87_24125 [Desulfobacteraceae bacterium]|jgi:hypothetical protein
MTADFGGQIFEILLSPATGIAAIIILLVMIVCAGIQFIKDKRSEHREVSAR